MKEFFLYSIGPCIPAVIMGYIYYGAGINKYISQFLKQNGYEYKDKLIQNNFKFQTLRMAFKYRKILKQQEIITKKDKQILYFVFTIQILSFLTVVYLILFLILYYHGFIFAK